MKMLTLDRHAKMPNPLKKSPMDAQAYKKLVIVGDAGCGKTSMVRRFVEGTFYEDYEPTDLHTQLTEVAMGSSRVELALWDTAGLHDYDVLRPLAYPDKDVVLLCFSIYSAASFEQIYSRWLPEVRHHCPEVPVILVGLQKDCKKRHVSQRQACAFAKKAGLFSYVECSAKEGKGVQTVFKAAAKAAMMSSR